MSGLVSLLTEVDVVLASTLAVHLVNEEAGRGFEQQAEDGHARTEAKQVPARFHLVVKDAEVDDVGQYGHGHPQQKLQDETKVESEGKRLSPGSLHRNRKDFNAAGESRSVLGARGIDRPPDPADPSSPGPALVL